MEVALSSTEVRSRLSSIPVYTVANSKDEFVLVSDDSNQASGSPSQLGIFFLNQADAKELIERIKQQDKALAKDVRIQALTMDVVIDAITRPESVESEGITFRFMPDQKQVQAALGLYADAGVPVQQITGIPIFQAEGLTISNENKQYTPMFLAKEDLDIALGTAHSTRKSKQSELYAQKAQELMAEYETAQKEYVESSDGDDKKRAKDRADTARISADKAFEKAEKVKAAGFPKVEVGSFEEVIVQMQNDTKGIWSSVMFIPPGALSGALSGKQEASRRKR